MSTLNEQVIRDGLDLTDLESAIAAGAETSAISQSNKVRVYTDIYVTKKLQCAVDKLTESNETLSKSNDKRATAMNWLTLGLLVVAVLQLVVALRLTCL